MFTTRTVATLIALQVAVATASGQQLLGVAHARQGQAPASYPAALGRIFWTGTTKVHAVARRFDPAKDTPVQGNFADPASPDGHCLGDCLFVVAWYKKLIDPVLGQWATDSWFSRDGRTLTDVQIVKGLRVKGPVSRANIESWRLRQWSQGKDQVVKAAISTVHRSLSRGLLTSLPFFGTPDPVDAMKQVASELRDPSRSLSLITISRDSWGGHALVAWALEEGTARVDGLDQRAFKIRVWDPNATTRQDPATGRTILEPDLSAPYILYLPGPKRFSIPSIWARWYGPELQPGPHFEGRVAVSPVHSALRWGLRDALAARDPPVE